MPSFNNPNNKIDNIVKYIFFISGLFSIIALMIITLFLFNNGIPFIKKMGFTNFILETKWSPFTDPPMYGILSMIITSIYVTFLSVTFGSIFGIFTALCLYKFVNKKIVPFISQMVNLLAGIPSVIYGLFGLNILVPFIRDNISPTGIGYGILSASIVLGIMILPTIISISLDALIAIPQSYYEGALVLGATEEEAVFKIILPSANRGILTSIILAIGRAIGETMAVIMIIGGSAEFPKSLFQSVRTLTSNIAMGATELSGEPLEALIATGTVLFIFTLLLNITFSYIKTIFKNNLKG
ncbi:phosphate ABC transporter permease subunit PstC [Fusobacterium sp. PH5-44]|uniref:phosphate ABC transporter permease subunit PstC n=1 Tax=unclassified Fusobacterium TaxID=2648384 RepID=UPI003D23972B